VVGFDDIPWAAFHTPSLTTVRQPLGKMGRIAAETLLRMIEAQMAEHGAEASAEIAIEPTLVVRESTGSVTKP
jgi:DNA-binding LacI/PurR family transcriptional regulator